MGGRGSGGGRSGGGTSATSGSSQNTNSEILKRGEYIYKQKISQNVYVTRKDFNMAKEYIKENLSKKEILKLAKHYKDLFDNRINPDPFSVSEFKSRELMLRDIAKNKK